MNFLFGMRMDHNRFSTSDRLTVCSFMKFCVSRLISLQQIKFGHFQNVVIDHMVSSIPFLANCSHALPLQQPGP